MANLILSNIKHVHRAKSGMALCHDYGWRLMIIYIALHLAVELLKIQVFCVIGACRLVNISRCSEGVYCCHLQDQAVQNPWIFNKTATGKSNLTRNSLLLWNQVLALNLSSREDCLLNLHISLWMREVLKEWTIKGYCVDRFVIPEVFA